MTELTLLKDFVKQLEAGLGLISLAKRIFPRLVTEKRTTQENVEKMLAQIPALHEELLQALKAAKDAMDSVTDRLETLAQFLQVHRATLTPNESEELAQIIKALKG
jgi:hypothetical protein